MPPIPIKLAEKFQAFTDQWSPKIIAQTDEYQFKLAKLSGDFIWHAHAETDEVFMVVEGQLRIDFRDGDVTVGPGEMLVVPNGVEHKPFAAAECQVMIFVRKGTVNTGDTPAGERTAADGVWI